MSKPIMGNQEITLEVEGRGDTKDQALGAAFSNIQKQVGGMPLRIEPLDVEVLQATETQRSERFLLLFFPRIRSTYHLRLKVQVRVVSIHVEKITFQTQTERSLFH